MSNEVLTGGEKSGNGSSISRVQQLKNEALIHNIFSARECVMQPPQMRTIETMQQLFILKQLPAEQFMQDVPPGPGPFPQKTFLHDFNSNPMTENQGIFTTAVFQNNSLNEQQYDEDEFRSILMLSIDQPQIAVPSALAQNDFAMNVPTSFDQRDKKEIQGISGSSRLNSNHLLLHQGVTNPNEKDFQSNNFISAHVRVSDILEEDGLNQHWIDLMQLGGDLRQKKIGRETSDLLNAPQAAFQVPLLESVQEQHNQTVFSDTLQSLQNGQVSGNLMIYSTLAAAFPYSLKTVLPIKQEVGRSLTRKNRDINKKCNIEMPKLIQKENPLDLSRQNTEIKIDPDNFREVDAGEDSADNLNDIDEKEEETEFIRDGQVTPTSGLATIAKNRKVTDHSDGENVEMDDEENPSKAFEARESQWNRKLSIKQSEEKNIHQHKIKLTDQIVKAFEEARNYYQQHQSIDQQEDRIGNGKIEQGPLITDQKQLQLSFKNIETLTLGRNIIRIDLSDTQETKKDRKEEIGVQTIKSSDVMEKVLMNDQEDILKPMKSNNFSNKHQGGVVDITATLNFESPQNRCDYECHGSAANTKQGTQHLVTHNLNLMTTLKISDLKLHLNQHNTESVGAVNSQRVFGTNNQSVLQEMAKEVFIRENDSNLLLWAQSLNTLKIKDCIKKLLKYIELLAVSRLSGPQIHHDKLPTHTHLIFNLHELENLYLLKVNEVSQKQSMKLIIINSTGRHRKAPSDFQSAKTIKRQEMHESITNRRVPSMSRTKRLLGQDNRMIQPVSERFKKQQRKHYMEEDSMMMYDSNVHMLKPVKTTSRIERIEDLQFEDDQDAEESLQLRDLTHSKSSQNFSDLRPKSILRDLIKDFPQPQYKHINSSGGSNQTRQNRLLSSAKPHDSERALQNLQQSQTASTSKISKQQHLKDLVEGRYSSFKKSNEQKNIHRRQNSEYHNISKVGIEGKTKIGEDMNKQASTPSPLNLHHSNQHKPKVLIMKKGVTSGMKLVQSKQKNDKLNLDLTIQIDANEELKDLEEEGKTNPMLSDLHSMRSGQSQPFLDGMISSPNINLEKRQPIQLSMIGEMRQFSKIMHLSKDSFAKRLTERQNQKQIRGVGLHARQQDPLGSIALSSSESVSISDSKQKTNDHKRYFN